MKQIKIEDSVGCILSHDVTKIVPGEFKGRLFKKGHVIKEEDIEMVKSAMEYCPTNAILEKNILIKYFLLME